MARGRARQKEIAAASEAERKVIETKIIESLGRPATALDELAAEQISAAVVRGRRKRQVGRDDSEERRSIAQLMRASNFKPDRPQPAPKLSIRDQLAARGYSTPETAK
jgi:hypothetical protein